MTSPATPPLVRVPARGTRFRLEERLNDRMSSFKSSDPAVLKLLVALLGQARTERRFHELNFAIGLPNGKSMSKAIEAILGSENIQVKLAQHSLLISSQQGWVQVNFSELETVELELLASAIQTTYGAVCLHPLQEQRWKQAFIARFRKRR